MQKEKLKPLIVICIRNSITFLFVMFMINILSTLFGKENTLSMVAITIAIQMAPNICPNIKLKTKIKSVFLLFLGCGVFSSLSMIHPFLGILINILFLSILLPLTCEPFEHRLFIPFLLCYIFTQSTPVSGDSFLLRMIAITLGAVVISILILIKNRNQKQTTTISLCEYYQNSLSTNKSFIIRMVIGLSIALFIGDYFNLIKPLWISIVVMSITQRDFKESKERIYHRIYATFAGIILFILIFQLIVPDHLTMVVILFFGYLMGFLTTYKHKQILNTISAIYASLVLLDTTTAILERFLYLFIGIGIVLLMYLLHYAHIH